MRLHRGFAAVAVCALGATALVATPTAATAAEPGIRINEVESSDGVPGDWIELFNPTAAAIDLGGYSVKDSDDDHVFTIVAGTTVAAGGYLVLDALSKTGAGDFDFGLGGSDAVRVFDTTDALVDERSWTEHGSPTWGVRDGASPTWEQTSESTRGAANVFTSPEEPAPAVVINEIVYDGVSGVDKDSIELYNAGSVGVDLTGWKVADEKRAPFGTVPSGVLAPGAFLVLEKDRDFAFGLGRGDEVALFDAADVLVDDHVYPGTAPLADWSRCPDGSGDWAPATAVTLGAANVCGAPSVPGAIRINEIDSQPSDWVEFVNPGTEALDISGYEIRDNSDDHRWKFLPGTSIAGGALLVVEGDTDGLSGGTQQSFGAAIGIGSADRIRLFDAAGALIDDSLPWEGHAAIGGDAAAATLARCPDGEGAFVLAHPTRGATNSCVPPSVAINEVESNGDATDWVEVVNTGSTPVDLSGWTLMDSDPVGHAGQTTPLPAGTTLAAGAFFVFDERTNFTFGLGNGDTVTVRDAGGNTVAEHTYAAHAAGVWARCADGTGEFADVPVSTKGAVNSCGQTPGGQTPPAVWPGSPDVTVVDATATFLEDSSGLDVQVSDDGAFLWAVDNGTGRFWKLALAADGTASFAPGWEAGKRARFQRDAANAAAAGPDAEGITVAGDGFVYIASERDNGAKDVNQNIVLKVDPTAPGPDVVATQQWDLTAQLPAVGANLGIEAVEWVADSDLTGKLIDATTGAQYDPSRYPGHGDGLFFVVVEDTGDVYGFALNADGTASPIATIDTGLPAAMALDYDSVLGVLWAVCDNGCQGTAAQITFDGTADPAVAHVARPANMDGARLNNEGFATAPAALVVHGQRPAWWFADGEKVGALRVGTLPAAGPVDPTDPTGPTNPIDPADPTLPTVGGSGSMAPPASALVDSARHDVSAPHTAERGERITISVGAEHAGTAVDVWMYSTPVKVGSGALDAIGQITVTIPKDAPLGAHRLAVSAIDGTLLGWTDIRIVAGALAATGVPAMNSALFAGLGMLVLGGALVLTLRRRVGAA